MNTLKSILLSSVLILQRGGRIWYVLRTNWGCPSTKTHRTEAAPLAVSKTAGQDRLRGKNGRFVKVKKTKAAAGVEVAARKVPKNKAEAAAIACPPCREKSGRISTFLPTAESNSVLDLSNAAKIKRTGSR